MPAAVGQVADLASQLGVDAVGDEVVAGAVGADHAERAVPGAGELAGRLHDPAQHAVQVEVGRDRHHGVEQRLREAPDGAARVAGHRPFLPGPAGRVRRR